MSNKLSISIVSYHNDEDVLLAIDSIEKCTSSLLDKTIYVVDNSEKDLSIEGEQNDFAKKLSAYEDVKLISLGENVGFGKGHNTAINKADSQYHAIVNPDIILEEDAFFKLIEFMEKSPDCGMCIPKIMTRDGELQKAYRRELTVSDMFIRMFIKGGFKKKRDHHTMQDMDYSKPFNVPFAQGSFLLARTELLKKVGGFDDRFFLYMEDADLCKRVNEVSSVMYCPYAKVIHKWEKGSHKNRKLFKYHVSSMNKYFKKWGWKWR